MQRLCAWHVGRQRLPVDWSPVNLFTMPFSTCTPDAIFQRHRPPTSDADGGWITVLMRGQGGGPSPTRKWGGEIRGLSHAVCRRVVSVGRGWLLRALPHRWTSGALVRFSFGLHEPDESAFVCHGDRQSSGETSGRTKGLSSGQTLGPKIQLGTILKVLFSVATTSLVLMMTKTAKLWTPARLTPSRLAPPRLPPPRLAPPRLAPPSPAINSPHFPPSCPFSLTSRPHPFRPPAPRSLPHLSPPTPLCSSAFTAINTHSHRRSPPS